MRNLKIGQRVTIVPDKILYNHQGIVSVIPDIAKMWTGVIDDLREGIVLVKRSEHRYVVVPLGQIKEVP